MSSPRMCASSWAKTGCKSALSNSAGSRICGRRSPVTYGAETAAQRYTRTRCGTSASASKSRIMKRQRYCSRRCTKSSAEAISTAPAAQIHGSTSVNCSGSAAGTTTGAAVVTGAAEDGAAVVTGAAEDGAAVAMGAIVVTGTLGICTVCAAGVLCANSANTLTGRAISSGTSRRTLAAHQSAINARRGRTRPKRARSANVAKSSSEAETVMKISVSIIFPRTSQ